MKRGISISLKTCIQTLLNALISKIMLPWVELFTVFEIPDKVSRYRGISISLKICTLMVLNALIPKIMLFWLELLTVFEISDKVSLGKRYRGI